MHDDCTHDREKNENYEENEERELGELRSLLDHVGDSTQDELGCTETSFSNSSRSSSSRRQEDGF